MTNAISTIGHRTETLEDLRQCVPAAFSPNKHPDKSSRYSFVSTEEMLKMFLILGWAPYSGRQNGASQYSRHIVRLNNPALGLMDLRSDKIRPQIIFDNSHNGGSAAQLHLGLFRLVCTNGLVISMPGMYSNVKFRHIGVDFEKLKALMETIATQYTVLGTHIGDMQNVILNQTQKEEFAVKAMAYREHWNFINEDGTINIKRVTGSVNPVEILKPIRSEDANNDLWTVFNLLQERMIKGDFERKALSGRKASPKPIVSAKRNIEFNKILWSIAEEYLGTRADAVVHTYTNAKGVTMPAEILQELGNNSVQIKANGRIFAVNADKLS